MRSQEQVILNQKGSFRTGASGLEAMSVPLNTTTRLGTSSMK